MMSKCPNCHKPYRVGAGACQWCGYALPPTAPQPPPPPPADAPQAAGPGKCPDCGRKFPDGAPKCIWCGRSLDDVEIVEREMTCPICKIPLVRMEHEAWILYMCRDCQGTFIPTGVLARFEHMYASIPMSQDVRARRMKDLRQDHAVVPPKDVDEGRFYRPCPQCGQLMQRRRYQKVSNVVIDECLGHGVWFDPEEFGQAVAFLKEGGLEARRRWTAGEVSPGTGETINEIQSFAEKFGRNRFRII